MRPSSGGITQALGYCRATGILDENDETTDDVRLHNAVDMELAEAIHVLTNGHQDMETDFQAARELAVQATGAAEYLRYGAAFDGIRRKVEQHQAHHWSQTREPGEQPAYSQAATA